jgi:excisionase family DNA binding protein
VPLIATTEYLNVKEVAELLNAPPSWVYDNHKTLGMPSITLGGLLRFPRLALLEWAGSKLKETA